MAVSHTPGKPPWAGRVLSPMLRQYVEAKEENPDAILMFRMGDFFELFFDDAKLAAELLDLTLTARDKGDNPVPMAGVPHHAVENYIARLVSLGHSVALCDQIEDPKATKGLVKRAITRLITPGTICELDALDPGQSSFLAAVVPVEAGELTAGKTKRACTRAPGASNGSEVSPAAAPEGAPGLLLALAFFDLLAGELVVTLVAPEGAVDELRRMHAREVLGDAELLPWLQAGLRREGVALRPLHAGRRLLAKKRAPLSALAPSAKTTAKISAKSAPKPAASAFAGERGRDHAVAAAQIGEPELPQVEALAAEQRAGLSAQQEAAVLAACREAVAWASHTQRRSLAHVGRPRLYRLEHALIMDAATRQNLELTHTQVGRQKQGSLLAHLNVCRTAMGGRLLGRWVLAPLRRRELIARRADGVEALVQQPAAREALREALGKVRDLERLAGRVAVGRATPRDLLALGHSLLQVPSIERLVVGLQAAGGDAGADAGAEAAGRSRAQAPTRTDAEGDSAPASLPPPEAWSASPPRAPLVLAEAWEGAPSLQPLAEELTSAIVAVPPTLASDGGVFNRGYETALDALMALTDDVEAWLRAFEVRERARSGIASLKLRYNRVFGYNIEVPRAREAQVPEDYVRRQSLANAERYVTPELKQFEQRALRAQGERKERELQLFCALTAKVAAELPALKALARLLAQTDATLALACVAVAHRYVRPTLADAPMLKLQAARHPVLEASLPAGERFVANDFACDTQKRALTILTGPNMAGKSTLMRQTALCAVMAQMGGFVPATQAHIGIVDRLFVRVGASDNLGLGHSTFMVEMVETAAILRQASRQSLVLLDEIGRGTSTFDGLSIAWAVAEYLHDEVGCRTLFATHYHELTELTRTLARAVAMQVTVHEEDGRLIFLRQLREGAANRSYGIEVARLAHVPQPVLARARQVLAALEEDAAARPSRAPHARARAAGAAAAARVEAAAAANAFAPVTAPADVSADGSVANGSAGRGAAEQAASSRSSEAGPPVPQPPRRRQLSLFAGPDAAADVFFEGSHDAGPANAVLDRLRGVDVNQMTPLEALGLLASLQKLVKPSSAAARNPRRARAASGRPGTRPKSRAGEAARLDGPQLLP